MGERDTQKFNYFCGRGINQMDLIIYQAKEILDICYLDYCYHASNPAWVLDMEIRISKEWREDFGFCNCKTSVCSHFPWTACPFVYYWLFTATGDSLAGLSVSLHYCVWVFEPVHMCVHACWGWRLVTGALLQCSSLQFWSLTEPEAPWFAWIGYIWLYWLVNEFQGCLSFPPSQSDGAVDAGWHIHLCLWVPEIWTHALTFTE